MFNGVRMFPSTSPAYYRTRDAIQEHFDFGAEENAVRPAWRPISGKYSDGGHVQELVAVPYKPCALVVLFPRAIPRATRMPFSEGPKRKPVLIQKSVRV